MLSTYLILIFNIVIINLGFSFLIFLFFVKFTPERFEKKLNLLIYSFGLGPAITGLLLYYLLLILPGHHPTVYVLIILAFILLLFFITKGVFLQHLFWIKELGLRLYKESRIKFGLIALSILGFLIVWITTVVNIPILRHDTFEYAVHARNIAESRQVEYKKYNLDDETYFYYVAQHGLTFPLISTWEQLVNTTFNIESDLYFRSVSGYYWILTILVFISWIYKKDWGFVGIAAASLALAPGFLASLFYYHVDTFRIFFLSVATTLLTKNLGKGSLKTDIATGIFLGMMMNAHAIGAFIGIIALLLFFLFCRGNIKMRLKRVLTLALSAIFFGAVHYALDTFFGTGWIFVYLDYYFPEWRSF